MWYPGKYTWKKPTRKEKARNTGIIIMVLIIGLLILLVLLTFMVRYVKGGV